MSTSSSGAPMSYASLAPFYSNYFVAYGANFWRPNDMPRTNASSVITPPQHSDRLSSHDGRIRSTSVSSRKVAEQRASDPTSITDMFAKAVMTRYRHVSLSHTVTIDAPAAADDPGKYTAFDVYVAMGKTQNTISLPSTRWGPMPSLFAPLVLPPNYYYTIFSKRFTPFGWQNLLRVWFTFTQASDLALEDWTRQVLVNGKIPSSGSAIIATKALSAARLSEEFKKNYTAVVQNKELLEMFIENQMDENWSFEADPDAIDNNSFSTFMRDQVLYLIKDFEHNVLLRLLWDGAHVIKWYPTVTSNFRMPYPGETLSSSLQFRARKLLVWIAGKSPHSIEEIEAEFAKLQGRTIRPSIRFFLSKSLLVMAIRVVYVIGVKRIAVALTRESTGNIPTSQTGEKMFPVHILSFAGTFLLMNLFRLSRAQEMHGEDVFEMRPFWHSSEVDLFGDCCDTLNTLMAIPDMQTQIEAVLIKLYQEFDHHFVLLANEQQTMGARSQGFDYTYSVPICSTCLSAAANPLVSPPSGPVFTRQPPTTDPSPALASSSSATPLAPATIGTGGDFPLASSETGYESDSEDELNDNEGYGDEHEGDSDFDEGDTAYPQY